MPNKFGREMNIFLSESASSWSGSWEYMKFKPIEAKGTVIMNTAPIEIEIRSITAVRP
tara:strand:+ start:401 stop:574 length:174 start_codon:yes stop_codon:yes gene_type:complete